MDYANIVLSNIGLELSGKQILKNINVTLEGNKIYLFLGKSGSGKTSLLNIMNFLYTPTSGTIQYQDTVIKSTDEDTIERLRATEIAYFQQELSFIENLSIWENFECFAKVKKQTIETTKIEEYAETLGILNFLDENISVLSGGERQRAAFLKLLVFPSSIILFDEPTNNLDTDNVQIIMQCIQMLKEQGKLIVIVSHSEEMKQIADVHYTMEMINER